MESSPRSTIYWTSFWVSFFMLWFSLMFVCRLAERAGFGPWTTWLGTYGWAPSFFFASMVATVILRRKGLSAERTVREILTGPIHGEMPDPVELRTEPNCWRNLALAYTIPVALFTALIWTTPRGRAPELWELLAEVMFVGIFCLCVYKAIIPGPPVARLDSESIYRGAQRRTVPWDLVNRCEITTTWSALGTVARVSCVLYGADDKSLLKFVFVAPIRPGEELFFDALRSRFSLVESTSPLLPIQGAEQS